MNSNSSISDLTFIGSGISTSFSIIKLLDLIDTQSLLPNCISINIIEKYSEFNLGIPYGSRSGFSTLLITSLRNFLPEPELDLFKKWLNINKKWLLNEFAKEGGILSKKWLVDNEDAIKNNDWDELFIPRRFFGCYINEKVNNKINELIEKGIIKVNFINGNVIDVEKKGEIYNVLLSDKSLFKTKKIILSVGSLPKKNLWLHEDFLEKENLLFINKPYEPELKSSLTKIVKFLKKRENKKTNVLIVGANASALEIIYKLNDVTKEKNESINFTFLSTHGRVPDAIIYFEQQEHFIPKHLDELKKHNNLTAKLIAEATYKDLDYADELNLGAATTVDVISKYFGSLLNKLNSKELEMFACKYGNDIGRRQRCAGLHYSNVITSLNKQKRFNHISGRFKNLEKTSDNVYKLNYIETNTELETVYEAPIHVVINCIGSETLKSENIPHLIKNLISKGYCAPNESQIGFHVNDLLEAHKNLHIMGPMLAGNVIENNAVWHVEHCGRIIWLSDVLSKILYHDLNFKHTNNKNYELETHSLNNDLIIENYKSLLKKHWNNNIYYAYDHLKYFENDNSSLNYFLFNINGSPKILMPIILRKVNLLKNKSKYFDAITPYGYSGPLYDGTVTELDLKVFWKSVDNWYLENNVITEFIRFSLNKNYVGYSGLLLSSLSNVKGHLETDFDKQWESFLPKVRNNYRKAQGFNLAFKIFNGHEISTETIRAFKDIYTETMKRLNAKSIYYFSLNYFNNLILNNKNEFSIAFAYLDDIPISAELIIKNKNTLFAFLGGTDSNYYKNRPNDFLRVEIIKWAIKNCFKCYVLGGGVSDGDGLYKSKKALFPKNKDVQFYTGRKVINHQVYAQIIKEIDVDFVEINSLIFKKSKFFPVYRSDNCNNKENSFSFEVLQMEDAWKKALEDIENYDFYHTYDYHNISKEKGEKAILIRYVECDKIICLPLIIRKINGTKFYDATSVYGYAGPINKNIDSNFDNSNFKTAINEFFEKENIISVFSRLNPFINNQDKILSNIGKISVLSNVVNIDLSLSPEDQRTIFSKTTKRYLNKGRRFMDIKISRDEKDVDEFIKLYYKNMDRVNAKDKYYFSKKYFYEFINSNDYKTDVIFAILKETGEIISAALMVKTNNIVQYHLSGTKIEFLNLSPIRLLIDEMRILATQEKYTYFNLGGGLGSEEDELFRFKSSFSKDFKPFKIWKYIVNQDVYNDLVNKADLVNADSDFFPLYRQ